MSSPPLKPKEKIPIVRVNRFTFYLLDLHSIKNMMYRSLLRRTFSRASSLSTSSSSLSSSSSFSSSFSFVRDGEEEEARRETRLVHAFRIRRFFSCSETRSSYGNGDEEGEGFAARTWISMRSSSTPSSREEEGFEEEEGFGGDLERKPMSQWTSRETLEFIAAGTKPAVPEEIMDAATLREYESMKREIERAPAKRRRFLLNQALKGRAFKSIQTADDAEEKEKSQKQLDREAMLKQLKQKVIDVNRTCKVTKGGGLMNFTAMVVVGDGRGVVGFATGKANEVGAAIEKATRKASKSLTYIERFENHTIYHELHGKCGKTRIKMMPCRSGVGRRCNTVVDAICELAGISNLKAKVYGSHHPHNTVRAVFEAFASMQTPRSVAEDRGVKVFQI